MIGAFVAGLFLLVTPSPAEQRIAQLRQTIAQEPTRAQGHAELALALARRARETGDPAFYELAAAAVERSLALAPDNVEALRAGAWVLLGQHDFARALEVAEPLRKRVPDDVMVYGLLTDAYVELGRYQEAEASCQWMLDLRPGNVPALTRAAYLRELFGDVDGALELFAQALDSTPLDEAEDRAWILTQVGHLHLQAGRTTAARQALEDALSAFPEYHYALGTLGRVLTAERRYAEAVAVLKRRQEQAPHPENLYELAEALQRAGRRAEAREAFRGFETAARREMAGTDNANRELILYYVDHAGRPAEALQIAAAEVARRRDLHTLDAYAWALHATGHSSEALRQMEAALAVGVRDARLFRHALAISRKAGNRAAARRYASELRALELARAPAPASNPSSS